MIGPGQTQVGGKTNKVSGKTFCIPPAGGNFNSPRHRGHARERHRRPLRFTQHPTQSRKALTVRRLSMPLVIVVAAFLMFLPARAAFADGCTDLGGVVVGAECQISGDVGEKSGTYNLEQSLRILAGAKIIVPPSANGNTLTIGVCATPAVCDFVMDPGAWINGQRAGGRRGPGRRRDHRHLRHGKDSARRRRPHHLAPEGGLVRGRQGRQRPPDGGREHLDPGRLRHLRRRQAVPGGRHHAARHPGHGHRRRAALLGEHALRDGRAASVRAVGRSR